ncbi:MAG: hypothetical protein O8C61_10945 [Candidatus Methanoperedens sp.]|nr:hypothetical protein [Candidatus Methanoperedens sp.]
MNLWKKFALVMVALLVIVAGIRFIYVETHTFKIEEGQKLFAINAARNGLGNEIMGNNYNITVHDRGWIVSTTGGDKKVVQVILTGGNVTFTALVDMDTGKVVEKTWIESLGWMTEHQDQDVKRNDHLRLFNR